MASNQSPIVEGVINNDSNEQSKKKSETSSVDGIDGNNNIESITDKNGPKCVAQEVVNKPRRWARKENQNKTINENELAALQSIKSKISKVAELKKIKSQSNAIEVKEGELLDIKTALKASQKLGCKSLRANPINVDIEDERSFERQVEDARKCLLGKFSLRQLKEFICDCEARSRPTIDHNAHPPVRRNQAECRDAKAIYGDGRGKLLFRERPSFRFVLMQVGRWQGYLPTASKTHPQQQERPNAIIINPVQRRMTYEFTVYNRFGTMCYSVWTVPFATIEAMYFSKDLFYLRINTPAQQAASFFGAVAQATYDVSDGELPTSLLHYFRFQSDCNDMLKCLMRYDRAFFEPKIVSYSQFFQEVNVLKTGFHNQQELYQNPVPIVKTHPAMPNPYQRTRNLSQEGVTGSSKVIPRQLHTPPLATLFYRQSQYTFQNHVTPLQLPLHVPLHPTTDRYSLQNTPIGDNAPQGLTPCHVCFSKIDLVDPNYQMSKTPRGNAEGDDLHSGAQNDTSFEELLASCESNYFPGALLSQTSMRRDSEYLLDGMPMSIPQPIPTGSLCGFDGFRPANRHFSDLQAAPPCVEPGISWQMNNEISNGAKIKVVDQRTSADHVLDEPNYSTFVDLQLP